MKGYKAFDKGLICKGKQYQENTVFEEEKAVICDSGMHFCESPFDVWDYYDMTECEFTEVEALAEVKTDDTRKYCTTKLKIGAKLTLPQFINAGIEFILEKTKVEAGGKDEEMMSSKTKNAQIGSSGYYAKIGSSGDSAKIGSSGNCAKIGSSGDSAKIGSSGNSAKIGSSGNCAQIGSSGYSAKIGSSGYSAKIGSSGDSAKIGSSGNSAKINSEGEYSVICCAGHGGKVKAKKGSWITLSEWEFNSDIGRYIPLCVKTEFVDGEKIKADTYYILKDGEFKEYE